MKADCKMMLVVFHTRYHVESPNHMLYVVGSSSYLGKWVPELAAPLKQEDIADRWSGEIKIPNGESFDWKLIVMDNKTGHVVRWEDRENRFLNVIGWNTLHVFAYWNHHELFANVHGECAESMAGPDVRHRFTKRHEVSMTTGADQHAMIQAAANKESTSQYDQHLMKPLLNDTSMAIYKREVTSEADNLTQKNNGLRGGRVARLVDQVQDNCDTWKKITKLPMISAPLINQGDHSNSITRSTANARLVQRKSGNKSMVTDIIKSISLMDRTQVVTLSGQSVLDTGSMAGAKPWKLPRARISSYLDTLSNISGEDMKILSRIMKGHKERLASFFMELTVQNGLRCMAIDVRKHHPQSTGDSLMAYVDVRADNIKQAVTTKCQNYTNLACRYISQQCQGQPLWRYPQILFSSKGQGHSIHTPISKVDTVLRSTLDRSSRIQGRSVTMVTVAGLFGVMVGGMIIRRRC